ncbi:GNAT family N-acetyltransferase [Phenylobacterium sp.]|uniref:GNAT family N-acetyltransferase n=1 Tax=Phenylobacterium sp. TaxID=1871053 RepID=UPI00286B7EF0|nr:GNAT family N-acetyltransferase [Phenylobacterium sp.]
MPNFLETDRLVLRPFTTDDLEHLVELDSDPRVMTFLTGGKPTPRATYVENLPLMIAGRGRLERWIWAAREKASGVFVGWFSLRPDPAGDPDEAELGYRLRHAAWGRGLATEGAARLLEVAFEELGLRRVHAQTMSVNLASRRVMEKLGLTYVRTFFDDWPEVIAGAEHGEVEYELTRLAWDWRADAWRLRALARRLPDIPRWVELRAGLLRGEGEVFGLTETPELSFVYRDGDGETVLLFGPPDEAAFAQALTHDVEAVLAGSEQAAWLAERLPDWTFERGLLHLSADPSRLPLPDAGDVRFVDVTALADVPLPDDLREELATYPDGAPVSASFVDGRPVAFCYPGAVTETLWDVSIDTVPQFQRQGHAGLCAAHMIAHMGAQGRAAVWDAVEDNPASWKLAEKLGFTRMDEIAIFTAPGA